jgi:ATP-dependent helicase/nuclease subunit A
LKIDHLVDGEARRKIRHELGRTLVVEAAAGTGKTTELVQRIVALVQRGLGTLSSLVSVTFTEKAAGEMKLRIRTELDRALSQPALNDAEASCLRGALSELEAAKIGTIHGLCADLLREHPVEAEVDPAFEVADEGRARKLAERVFDRWFEEVLESPPEGVRRVLRRRLVQQRGEGARGQLFMAFSRLVETRDFEGLYRREPFDRVAAIDAVLRELLELAALHTRCRNSYDGLRRTLVRLSERLVRGSGFDSDALEELLVSLSKDNDIFNERKGSGKMFGPDLPRDAVLEQRKMVRANLDACVLRCRADLAACLQRELLPVVQRYEAEKQREGVLDFFDLLLLTRKLLVQHRDVRARLQARITHVLVDEFQDTDPVQSEILLLLAASDASDSDPYQARVSPGKLFVVGDPKQSIYRFRRADVSLYERVKRHLAAQGAEVLALSTSFRSLPDIQALVNASFEPVMAGFVERGQSAYVPLSPFRNPRADQPSVVALPAPAPYGKNGKIAKKAINESLPDAVASFLDWLVHKSGYHVLDGHHEVPIAARHVCLLFSRFRSMGEDLTREYVRALEARRIPHVLSGGRSFHTREEVIAMTSVLTAIEWPDDSLAVYATLRGPFVAFHDESLWLFKERVGHLHPLGPVEREGLSPELCEVADMLAVLARLHRGRNRKPIAHTLDAFLREVRAHAGVAIWPTGEQALGNVLRVLDFARGYEQRSTAISFRGFVDFLSEHASLGETSEAPVIEETSDGVRIMTVHSAKGLEFPVVVLCDPTAPKRPQYASRFIDPARRLWAQALCEAEPYELVEQRELVRDHDEAERVRLAYVAATRAKDLLVVPTSGDAPFEGWVDVLWPALYPPRERSRTPLGPGLRCPPFSKDSVRSWPNEVQRVAEDSVAPGEHLPERGLHHVVWWDPHVLDLERPSAGGLRQAELLRTDEQSPNSQVELTAHAAFAQKRMGVLAQAAHKSHVTQTVTARALLGELGVPTAALDIVDTLGEREGRPSGARYGTLVHAVLAHGSLSPRQEEIAGLASHFARTLGASHDEQTRATSDLVRALGHPMFERMRAALGRGELYRETPIMCREADGSLLEGVVDACFREGERMVLVDFKTDVTLADPSVYARQLGLYATALEQVFALPVTCVLLRV